MNEFEKVQCTCSHGYTCRNMQDPNCCACSCGYNELVDALNTLQVERDALAAQVGDAFGDGYYAGFIAGGKTQQDYDLNLNCADGLSKFSDYALEASEDAECNKKQKSDRKHHLAANDAEVAAKAVEDAVSACETPMLIVVDCHTDTQKIFDCCESSDLKQYAAKLRAKAGE